MRLRELGIVSLLLLSLSIGYSLIQYTPIETDEIPWTTYGLNVTGTTDTSYFVIETAVSEYYNQMEVVESYNISNIMMYQWERPEGSGIVYDVWRVTIMGEGYYEGSHMWVGLMVHVIPEIGEVGIGPIIGGRIE